MCHAAYVILALKSSFPRYSSSFQLYNIGMLDLFFHLQSFQQREIEDQIAQCDKDILTILNGII